MQSSYNDCIGKSYASYQNGNLLLICGLLYKIDICESLKYRAGA